MFSKMCKHIRHQGKGCKQLSSHLGMAQKGQHISHARAIATFMDTKRYCFIKMGLVVCFWFFEALHLCCQ